MRNALAITLASLLLLPGCNEQRAASESVAASPPPIISLTGSIFGTTWSVKYPSPAEAQPSPAQVKIDVEARLAAIDALMSTWKTDSELSLLNASDSGQWQSVSPELLDLLSLARSITLQSSGAFDITVGPLVNLWGFGPEGKPEKIPPKMFIDAARARVGIDKFSLDVENGRIFKNADIYLDLSGIAKGYAVDTISALLVNLGLEQHLVEIGGELKARGEKQPEQAWQVGIEVPSDGQRAAQRVIALKDMALATSGDYRNYFAEDGVRYSHIIDPASGRPITHQLASISVLHPEAARADALATALFVFGTERALAFADQHNLAVFALVQDGDTFVESYSRAFEPYLR